MLTLLGRGYRHCDGLTRRQALVAGAAGFGGLTLADLLRAEAAAGVRSSVKSVINVHLDGGPPQHDTIDPKPDAPEEVRGEFQPIATRIPGLHVSELMPKVAGLADRFAFVRSLVGSAGRTTPSSASPGSRPRTCNRSAAGRRWGRWWRGSGARRPTRCPRSWT